MTRDFWIGLATLCASGLYWIGASQIRISPLDGPVGAAGLPKSLAYAMAALSIALMLRAIFDARATRRRVAATEDPPFRDWMRPHYRAVGMLSIGLVYLLVIPTLGYALAIMALLLAVSLYIGAGITLKTTAFAVAGGVFFHVLFVQFLDIPLPRGALIAAILSFGG